MIADHAFPHWEPVTDLDMLGSGLVGKTFLSTCPQQVISSLPWTVKFFFLSSSFVFEIYYGLN